jgi:GT2 family glycosyltransferase
VRRAILVHRETFLDTGGWDEGRPYYEDVELGWRFWLLGHEVWSSPGSIVYHRHHGTSGTYPAPPRMRLFERNSLRILYTHLERETLERVLPAAPLLACDRSAARDASEPRDGRERAARPTSRWRLPGDRSPR